MEMNSKQLLALAAIGAAVWYFMKKGGTSTSVTAATKPAIAPAAGSGGIWDGFGVGGAGLGAAMGQAAATAQPLTTPAAVYETGYNKPLEIGPAAAPAPASGGAVFGGTTGTPAQSGGADNGSSYGKPGPNGTWIWPDGTATGGGVTSSQAMSVMGY